MSPGAWQHAKENLPSLGTVLPARKLSELSLVGLLAAWCKMHVQLQHVDASAPWHLLLRVLEQRTLYARAAFSNSGAAASQSGLSLKSNKLGDQNCTEGASCLVMMAQGGQGVACTLKKAHAGSQRQ